MLSKRRIISVTHFHLQGRPVLKIYEKCSNGKIFFVILPCENNSEGWSFFLRLLQEKGAGLKKVLTEARRPSFAEVVACKSWPLEGRCGRCTVGHLTWIQVEKEGVAERLRHLERCLVFRFDSPAFQRWASRWWGVDKETLIQRLGDGLWMMTCNDTEVLEKMQTVMLKRRV
ncbi:hypothetical protein LINGRAHAP2_LOCUS3947 [Linum grandiflorum]